MVTLRGIDTLLGKVTLSNFKIFVPFCKGVYSIRKEFALRGGKFFPYRADPFSEGDWCAKKQTGNHNGVISFVKKAAKTPYVSVHPNSVLRYYNA